MASQLLLVGLLGSFTPVQSLKVVGPTATPEVNVKNYDPETSRTFAGAENVKMENLVEGKGDMFMRYMPDYNVVLCACAKCGTTSVFEYTYELATGTPWQDLYNQSWPYAQEVLSERWEGKIRIVNETAEIDKVMNSAYSLAVIRDPKERIISAWKSKLACDDEYGVDVDDRQHFVHDPEHTAWPRGFVFGFQQIYGAEENITCLTLPMFIDGLIAIKNLGRSKYLDRHFLPQDEGCFWKYPANKWSRVAPITSQDAFDELADKIGSKHLPMISSHASTKKVLITEEMSKKLDEVTKDEYAMLAPYLPDGYKSPVTTGQYFVGGHDDRPTLPSI